MNDYKILVVDDNTDILDVLELTLAEDYHIFKAQRAQEALDILSQQEIDLTITDQRMPGMTGVEFLEKTLAYNPHMIKILLTGYTDTENLIRAINQGKVYKYITKPFKLEELQLVVKRALEHYETGRENERLYQELQKTHKDLGKDYQKLQKEVTKSEIYKHIIGTSPAIQKIFGDIERISDSDINVLINGETGTGKELIARLIHQNSPRKDKKFVVQDCGSIPDSLLESELFGHKKGAFTGAISDKRGLLEIADGGTIFLDEIGETSPSMQIRLLRFLQEGEIRPVGSEEIKKVDVRVISATHRNLLGEMKEGLFTFPISLPPLRLRREDIPLLAAHFLSLYNRESSKTNKRLSREAINLLLLYDFPGNVRELENEIERAATMANESELIFPEHLSDHIREVQHNPSEIGQSLVKRKGKLSEMVEELERKVIEDALIHHQGNKTKAASEIGLSR
ncbi:MAG: sigma-54-dependent Fis family transcriptional regulator, partial [Deltaproteobacteria bacterium]|nr:sigma-54-dependent Fis family transcriptional regulator [Deltaproteobacteria bacterium]